MGFISWQRYCTATSSGRQPNFAALNRGCHLYSPGRPSRWALAHILVIVICWRTGSQWSVCSTELAWSRGRKTSLHELLLVHRRDAYGRRYRVDGWACEAVEGEKHVEVTLAMCWCMLNELPSITPRSRTQSTGPMSTPRDEFIRYDQCWGRFKSYDL